ncbi:GATA transcription factor 8 isoform X1 [Arachis hypogaea]|nr:GATA transcription factor 8 isoform X1 [Arachis hypogaea]
MVATTNNGFRNHSHFIHSPKQNKLLITSLLLFLSHFLTLTPQHFLFSFSRFNFLRKITDKMIEPNFVDDVDCGSFFDHIDDLLDFPADDAATADASLPVAAACAGNIETPASFWSSESNSGLPATDTAFPRGDAVTDLSAEISVPYEDIVQLEWLSTFVEDSFSGRSLTMKKVELPTTITTIKEDLTRSQFRTSSPVSVLESSSSCSREKVVAQCPEIYIPVVPCGRARSKRQRPSSFKAHPVMQLISPASSVGENTQPNVILKASSDSENFAESHPAIKLAKQASGEHKKKKKTKAPNPLTEDDDHDTNQNSAAARKCMHCEITKTPQWRAGPMGPKTLCNACGVRYKSGRLFPEYRPAASPTFCPAVHSNSHKKVLEMRNKFGFSTDSAASPELIPNTSRLGLEYM